MTGLIDFSTDAASNDTAAPPIFWGEGQPAKTVNNSNRAMMAALACWRDDNAGGLVATRGAGDAYALNTMQIFSAATAAKAHTVAFTVSAENQGPATLALDGNAAKPVLRRLGRQLGPGDLTTGILYRANYLPSVGAYLVVWPAIERPGRIAIQADAAADPGWIPCDGRLLSRVSYAALFAVIGTTYGAGDNATTFAIPDLRGRAPFGTDAGANRLSGNGGLAGGLGSAGGVEIIALSVAQLPPHGHSGSTASAGGVAAGTTGSGGAHDHGGATQGGGGHGHTGSTANAGGHSHTGSTDPTGHSHQFTTASSKITTAGSGSQITGLWSGGDAALSTTGTATSNTFTTSAIGDHAHGFTTNSVADHAHAIAAAAAHTHTTPAVPDHSHGLTINSTGDGAAHPNMPPGLVVAFAIKA